MSLKGFHIVFITLSLILAVGVGLWCLQEGLLGPGVLSFAAGGVLAVYGWWFLQKLRRWDEDAAKRKTSPIGGRPGGGGGDSLAAPHVGL